MIISGKPQNLQHIMHCIYREYYYSGPSLASKSSESKVQVSRATSTTSDKATLAVPAVVRTQPFNPTTSPLTKSQRWHYLFLVQLTQRWTRKDPTESHMPLGPT